MRILIIEDEDAAVRRLRKLLEQTADAHEIVAVLDSIAASVEWLSNHPAPDLALMDIHLADGSSFEIFKHATIQAPVIFTTAYDQYAVDAFRVNAIDYLLKPVKQEELKEALSRIRQQSDAKQEAPSAEDLLRRLSKGGLIPATQRSLVRIGQTMKIVDLNTTAYFFSKDKITYAVNPDGKRYPIDETLEQLDAKLDTTRFFRINRQFIICIDAIDEMFAYSKSRVKIKLNPPFTGGDVIVSTERSPVFKKWLEGN